MTREKLPRALKECERNSCHVMFEIKVGSKAKIQRKYCSHRCAALATAPTRKYRRRKRRRYSILTYQEKQKKVFSIIELQNFPVNFGALDGGMFAEICNGILNGELTLIGIVQ